jgi:hypothetical protein
MIGSRSIAPRRPESLTEWPHGKIPERSTDDATPHLPQCILKLQQMCAAKLEDVFLRLKCRASRVIQIWRACVFDVGSQHVHDLAGGRELYQPANALNEVGGVAHVEPAWIYRIAGQQRPRPPVVDGDRGRLVTRDRHDVQDAVAKIVLGDLARPVLDREDFASASALAATTRAPGI